MLHLKLTLQATHIVRQIIELFVHELAQFSIKRVIEHFIDDNESFLLALARINHYLLDFLIKQLVQLLVHFVHLLVKLRVGNLKLFFL